MKKRQGKTALLFLLPFLIVFFLFRFGPSIAGFFVGFTRWNIIGTAKFVALEQYARLVQDRLFFTSLANTLYFLVLTAPPLIVLSLLLAVLVNRKLFGRKTARTAIFLPYVIIPAVIGIIWNWLYDTNIGIINYTLSLLGLPPQGWLTDSKWAMISISATTVWWLMGYDMILFLAGLQEIPAELYESAQVDGASGVQAFFHITLPMLRPVTSIIVTLTMINVIKLFDQIYVMTGGGPGVATLTLVQYMYSQAFQRFNLGYGSAIAVVIIIVLTVLILLQGRILRRKVV